jgi:subtilisin family serine protease
VVPAASERRYVPNEVLVVVNETGPALDQMDRELRLTLVASQRIGLINATIRRYRLPRGANVAQVVRDIQRRGDVVTGAQPNYLYSLQGDAAAAPQGNVANPPAQAPPPAQTPAQYAISALKLDEAHRLAKGRGVIIAVIDSGIDETHPEIADAIAGRFDAVGGTFVPHPHGTAMAGAIVAHRMLVGAAPQARIFAIRAFADGAGSNAEGTGFNIIRGLDFAISHGAQIVNMSFAGPEDALLSRALEEARRQGTIAIAAAGNAGPSSPPLYPAAAPGVLAVTAIDSHNTPYSQANRGTYIAVAAPGVDVIAIAPGGMMRLTSGTSIATAEVSGVAALVIERNREASPDDMLRILRDTAHKLDVDPTIGGAGLIDALAALKSLPARAGN